jgi:hypothetical protein
MLPYRIWGITRCAARIEIGQMGIYFLVSPNRPKSEAGVTKSDRQPQVYK